MTRDEKMILNIFETLRINDNLKDDEYVQMEKILTLINKTLEKTKFDDDIYNVLEILSEEMEELRAVVAEKYLKIGKALGITIN